MPKIVELIDPAFRSGTSKTGKPWTLKKVRLDDGKEATGFDEIAIGDEVEVEYSEQHKNYSYSKPNAQKKAFKGLEEKIDKVIELQNKILVMLQTKPQDKLPTEEEVDNVDFGEL